ncbi:MAG: DUF6977 family protein [Candidatus Onthomonas sp.]
MAARPVFVPIQKAPFVHVYMPEFTWNGGFAVSQKQKNIIALHESFHKRFPDRKLLEISSKSLQDLGVHLSAFHLSKEVPSLGKSVPVECVFQGGKVFSSGGPYTDLYTASPRDAKRDPRLKSSGALRNFCFEGETMPLIPRTIFYNWLYVNALLENPQYTQQLLQFDGFTDIEFNPDKSVNCQAEAAALYVSLSRLGLLEHCRSFASFVLLFSNQK